MDIFKTTYGKVPEKSPNIIRVDMEQIDVGGRKSHLPNPEKSPMSISHVPSNGKGA